MCLLKVKVAGERRGLALALLLAPSLWVIGCSSGSSGTMGSSGGGGTPPAPDDVYVAGEMLNAAGAPTATYWKNGTPTVVGDPSAVFSDACCVAVDGEDVYVAGNVQYSDHVVAVVWKNGVVSRLSDGSSDAATHGIGIADGNVYVAGFDHANSEPVMWKNGQEEVLPDKGQGAGVNGLTVHGSSVYAVGFAYINNGGFGPVPAIWTDGALSFPEGEDTYGEAYTIVFSGQDVYLGGNAIISPQPSGILSPVYWKNGILMPLAGGSTGGYVYTLAISGTDVYVGGDIQTPERELATVWKNGVATDYSGTTVASFVNGLGFANGSLYAAGLYFPSAVMWKDGVLTTLATSPPAKVHPDAYSWTVVKH